MKKLFTVLAVLASLTLAACGGGTATDTSDESQAASQGSAGGSGTAGHVHEAAENAEWQANDSQHWKDCKDNDGGKVNLGSHTWVADESKTDVAATCQQTGIAYEKCSVCGKTRERTIAKTDHNWSEWATVTEVSCGEAGVQERHCQNPGCTEKEERQMDKVPHSWTVKNPVAASGEGVEYEEIECLICHATGLRVATAKATLDGSAVSGTPEGCIKLSKAGQSMQVKINVSGAKTGKIYLTACMDYWHDGNNDNQNNSYSKVKTSSNTANFRLTVNGTVVDMTDMLTVKYGEMLPEAQGETINDIPYSQIGDCLVGDVELQDGINTILYERVDSYVLAIKYFTVVFDK